MTPATEGVHATPGEMRASSGATRSGQAVNETVRATNAASLAKMFDVFRRRDHFEEATRGTPVARRLALPEFASAIDMLSSGFLRARATRLGLVKVPPASPTTVHADHTQSCQLLVVGCTTRLSTCYQRGGGSGAARLVHGKVELPGMRRPARKFRELSDHFSCVRIARAGRVHDRSVEERCNDIDPVKRGSGRRRSCGSGRHDGERAGQRRSKCRRLVTTEDQQVWIGDNNQPLQRFRVSARWHRSAANAQPHAGCSLGQRVRERGTVRVAQRVARNVDPAGVGQQLGKAVANSQAPAAAGYLYPPNPVPNS